MKDFKGLLSTFELTVCGLMHKIQARSPPGLLFGVSAWCLVFQECPCLQEKNLPFVLLLHEMIPY